jgi:predicted ATP-grasp superfamily ATP-dependent carboligase
LSRPPSRWRGECSRYFLWTRSINSFGQTLVIPLSVVMLDVLRDHPAEMTIGERDHPVQTLLLMERTKRSA